MSLQALSGYSCSSRRERWEEEWLVTAGRNAFREPPLQNDNKTHKNSHSN
uniref:Uncharacterized protein n=1 Tax=Anguilla anguilla TaxID=7936 RepID=A0A0E9PHS7_ANGAN